MKRNDVLSLYHILQNEDLWEKLNCAIPVSALQSTAWGKRLFSHSVVTAAVAIMAAQCAVLLCHPSTQGHFALAPASVVLPPRHLFCVVPKVSALVFLVLPTFYFALVFQLLQAFASVRLPLHLHRWLWRWLLPLLFFFASVSHVCCTFFSALYWSWVDHARVSPNGLPGKVQMEDR